MLLNGFAPMDMSRCRCGKVMKALIAAIFFLTLPVFAAAPPRGSDRLRELIVFPQMDVNINLAMSFQGDGWDVFEPSDAAEKISRLREELRQHPNDIQALLELGNLLDSHYETDQSQGCYEQAEKLSRDKVSANPEDGLALDDLGEALSRLGKLEEAENVYRKATLVSSNNWQCWVRLGNFLPSRSFPSMFSEKLNRQLNFAQPPPQEILDFRPPLEALKKAEDSLDEASRCFDRAVAIAPKEPEVFFQRAGYMSVSNWENGYFLHLRDNGKVDPSVWFSFFSKETVANLQKAADLNPQNYKYIGLAAGFEWFRNVMQAKSRDLTLAMLPNDSRRLIQSAMTQLENLSQKPDKKVAAGALQYLGLLNYVCGNRRAAASDFQRAVVLDPSREQSWDMLLGIYVKDREFADKAVPLCESRLKYKDSARNRLMLAKAYTYQKKWGDAEAQAEMAAGMETNNVVAPLLLAAIDLEQSSDPTFLPKALDELNRAQDLGHRLGSSTQSWARWREITLDQAIFDGLSDTADSEKTARECLHLVLKYYPNDETARQILSALN
jgi:tetratricopeptide (TPR) repeat protein